ncbi:cation-transporting ATPase [Microbacterium sp. KRD172]|uniref:cation-transporting ATPase n=1 Tax=Microbacterium sp. KRD172 TaxID=2729727 RepID=UPI0019D0E8D4|nr:cation-transporting ATPase [Microbacterium sp. KRD172]
MTLFDRLTGLAQRALNKTPAPAQTPGSEPRDWKSTLRGAVGAITGAAPTPPAPGSAPATPVPPAGPGHPLSPPAGAPAGTAPSKTVGLTSPPANDHASERAAVARYEYLLHTAEPAQLERIHADAFSRLTPAERNQIQARLRTELPLAEQPRTSQPADLARTATRAEAARPGALAGILARTPRTGNATTGQRAGVAAAGAAGGLLVVVAAGAIGSTIAAPLLAEALTAGVDFDALACLAESFGSAGGSFW